MAGTSSGATAPTFTSPPARAPKRAPEKLVHPASRTLRNHGVFLFDGAVAGVASSRRADADSGVLLSVNNGSQTLTHRMTPTWAHALGQALLAAAAAVEASQNGGAA